MLEAWVLTALLDAFVIGPSPVSCTFTGIRDSDEQIEIVMTPRPSLKDVPGLYRVEMSVNGRMSMPASAQPITSTDGRDVLVRGVTDRTTFYTVGFDDAGRAALNIMVAKPGTDVLQEATVKGRCQNYERYIERWSAS